MCYDFTTGVQSHTATLPEKAEIQALLHMMRPFVLLNDTNSATATHVRRHKPQDVGTSAIVAHELYDDAFKSQRASRNVALVEAFAIRNCGIRP
jgi:hypothetical protein